MLKDKHFTSQDLTKENYIARAGKLSSDLTLLLMIKQLFYFNLFSLEVFGYNNQLTDNLLILYFDFSAPKFGNFLQLKAFFFNGTDIMKRHWTKLNFGIQVTKFKVSLKI